MGKILIDLLEIVFVGLVVFFLVLVLFAGKLVIVTGDSMTPNFHDEEQLLAEKISLELKKLERGEVVIFHLPEDPEELIIKRIVGLPGEIIKISEGSVFINGEKLEEPYLEDDMKTAAASKLKEGEEHTIGNNSYILMGDNREKSKDSRFWGELNEKNIVGRVIFPINFDLLRR
jgi:signal peptidase I